MGDQGEYPQLSGVSRVTAVLPPCIRSCRWNTASVLHFIATQRGRLMAIIHHPEGPTGDAKYRGLGGVFAQRVHGAGTAPIITPFISGTPLKTTHLQKHA